MPSRQSHYLLVGLGIEAPGAPCDQSYVSSNGIHTASLLQHGECEAFPELGMYVVLCSAAVMLPPRSGQAPGAERRNALSAYSTSGRNFARSLGLANQGQRGRLKMDQWDLGAKCTSIRTDCRNHLSCRSRITRFRILPSYHTGQE